MSSQRPSVCLQLNVQLERVDTDAESSARAVFEGIRPLIRTCRKQHIIRWFFFLRKAPDIRLRFFGPNPKRDVLPRLESVFISLEARGAVRRHFTSIYEPEVRLFGGRDALNFVHAYFDADTNAWMDLDRLSVSNRRTLLPDLVAAGVLNDLFFRTLGERSEVWDVWANVAGDAIGEQTAERYSVEVLGIEDLMAQTESLAERRVLRRYFAANDELAHGLCGLWSRGALNCGLRGILPFVAVFCVNRHGLSALRRTMLARAMMSLLDPRRGMRGAY
jgi:thiopeptide-type bacteriocin biosynthesis protein